MKFFACICCYVLFTKIKNVYGYFFKQISITDLISLQTYKTKCIFYPWCAHFTKWSNALKQFVGKLPTNCLNVFDHFVGLAFKGLASGIFWLNQCLSFYQQTLLATFCFFHLHLLIQILRLEVRNFKQLRYTCECNNWNKLWKSTNLRIFLILLDRKFTRVWTFY